MAECWKNNKSFYWWKKCNEIDFGRRDDKSLWEKYSNLNLEENMGWFYRSVTSFDDVS